MIMACGTVSSIGLTFLTSILKPTPPPHPPFRSRSSTLPLFHVFQQFYQPQCPKNNSHRKIASFHIEMSPSSTELSEHFLCWQKGLWPKNSSVVEPGSNRTVHMPIVVDTTPVWYE